MIKFVRTSEPIVARSISLFWWKRIYLGSFFDCLTPPEQFAVIGHEEGHCAHHHTEMRILCLLLAPFLFFELCRRQEFSADRYSAQHGHSRFLCQVLESDYDGGLLHPSHAARREALSKYHDHPRLVPVTNCSPGSA